MENHKLIPAIEIAIVLAIAKSWAISRRYMKISLEPLKYQVCEAKIHNSPKAQYMILILRTGRRNATFHCQILSLTDSHIECARELATLDLIHQIK